MNERQRRHEIAHRHRFFRRWHRWMGIGAAAFLLFAAITGFLVAFTEFFGADERLREANRKLTSPVTSATPVIEWQPSIEAAIAAIQATDAKPIDRITVEFKGANPRILIFTGKVGGGEDSKYIVDAKTGKLLATEKYADKPFLYRLHSGEAFGDGGLVIAMLWALALILMAASGIYIYFSMRRRANIED
ncbi:MAG TPA: PepSY-associated TM helix domain-containing protein [Longimicrobiales bacterium]|nr:PepSY-associated TM helix domain-containing protein [Longimicrobiales bacterium]